MFTRRSGATSPSSTPTSCTSRAASATATRCARELAALDADTYLTELKGAAIDLVAEDALARGRRVVLAGNDVVSAGLDEALLALAARRRCRCA